MRKLLSLLLTLALVLPMFLVYSFASVNDLALKQQGIDRGFESLINIDEYISNAGNPGYQDFSLLSVNTDIQKNEYDLDVVKFSFYFYNPGTIDLEVASGELNNIVSLGSVSFFNNLTGTEHNSSLYMDISSDELEDVHILEDQMFIKAYFYVPFTDKNYSLTYYLNSINWTNGSNTVFNINQDFGVFDYEASIEESSPFMDLSFIMNVTVDSIKEQYPIDEDAEFEDCRLLFAYEVDEFLYIYLYYPRGESITLSSNFIYNFDSQSYESYSFGVVSSEAPLFKLKLDVSDLGILNKDVRDYYILSDRTIVSFSNSSNSSTNSASFKPLYEAHYTFSNSSLDNVEDTKFKYRYSFTLDLLKDQKYQLLLTSDAFNLDEFYFDVNWRTYIGSSSIVSYENRYILKKEKNLLEFFVTKDFSELLISFVFYTDFPLKDDIKYYTNLYSEPFNGSAATSVDEVAEPLCSTSTGYVTSSSLVEVVEPLKKASAQLLSSSKEDGALYLRVNQEEQIYINPGFTFYRLNSSATGLNYYQTLSSIYFSVPVEYLDMNDLNLINDRYVSQIELEYSSAMTTPIIFTCNQEIYDSLIEHKGQELDFFIYDLDSFDGGTYVRQIITDTFIGKKPEAAGFSGVDLRIDNYFEKYYYVVFCDEEFEPMRMVLTSEETLDLIKNDLHLVSDLEYNLFTLNFDEKKTISSFKDMSFEQMEKEFGWLNAVYFKIMGTKQYIEDTKSFNAIKTLLPLEIYYILNNYTYEEFSSKFAVDINDVENVMAEMEAAMQNNEAFVFVRFDIFDYYAEFCRLRPNYSISDSFYAQTKYYKDIDILALSLSNKVDTTVYSVDCEKSDFSPGSTVPDPIDKDKLNSIFNGDLPEGELADKIKQIVSFIFGCIMIVILWPVINFIITLVIDITKWIKKIFKKKE